jgi:CO dehydrogenase maturation factor
MAFVIALAGKGGTGKTTISGILIRYLIERGLKPVLAVDADPNSCLNEVLGVNVHTTVGRLREESLSVVRGGYERPGGMSIEELFDYKIQQSIIESNGFDLLVMGRPEGPGCYCAANNIIRKYTDKLSLQYPFVVIDNEAGLEHLSRRTTNKVDILIIVSDSTIKGLKTVKRIRELINELELDIKEQIILINRFKDMKDVDKVTYISDFHIYGFIPDDEILLKNDIDGKSIFMLNRESPAIKVAYEIFESIFRDKKLK